MYNAGSPTGFGRDVLVALVILWAATGTNFLGFKVALDAMPPFTLAAVRVLLAATVIAAVMLTQGSRLFPDSARIRGAAIASVFFVLLGQGVVVTGMQGLNSGQVALIMSCVPMMSAAFDWLFFGQKLHPLRTLGLVVGIAGMAMIVGGAQSSTSSAWPLVLVLTGAVGWAVGTVVSPRLTLPEDALQATFLQFLFGGIGLVVLAVLSGEGLGWVAQADLETAGAVLWVVLVGSVMGFGSFVYLRQRVDHAVANSFFYTAPIIALVAGALYRGERFSTLELMGGGIAVLGVVLVLRSSAPAKHRLQDHEKLPSPKARHAKELCRSDA